MYGALAHRTKGDIPTVLWAWGSFPRILGITVGCIGLQGTDTDGDGVEDEWDAGEETSELIGEMVKNSQGPSSFIITKHSSECCTLSWKEKTLIKNNKGHICQIIVMEGEVRERTVKCRQVMGALERVMKGNVSMEVKNGIRNKVILPTQSYDSETWMWNAAQQSRIRAGEMPSWI